MPGNYSKLVTVVTGQSITASERNNEFDNVINNMTPDGIDDASATLLAMQTTVDPSGGSQATSLRGEIQRLRFQLLKLGAASGQWYDAFPFLAGITPASAGATATDLNNRLAQLASQIKNGFGLTNWYDSITAALLKAGGTMAGNIAMGGNNITDIGALITTTANPASTGIIRLANTEQINWRDNANAANLTLATDTSNRLLYVGNVIASGTGLAIIGTSNQIIVSFGAGGTTLSTPQGIATSSSPTFAAETLTNTTNQLVLGTTRTITINAPTPASSSRVISIPDPGAAANFVLSEADATINGVKTFAGQFIGKGTATNDSAAAGYIGELVKGGPTTVSVTTAAFLTVASITLSAGDWDISFVCVGAAATSAVEIQCGVATTTNTSTGHANGDNAIFFPVSAAADGSGSVANYRVSISGSTTYYLTAKAFGATISTTGRISARRIR